MTVRLSALKPVPVAGLSARVTCSAYTSGSTAVSLIPYSAGGGSSGSGSVTQGTSPWVTSAADGGIGPRTAFVQHTGHSFNPERQQHASIAAAGR